MFQQGQNIILDGETTSIQVKRSSIKIMYTSLFDEADVRFELTILIGEIVLLFLLLVCILMTML